MCVCVCRQSSWETVGKRRGLDKDGKSETKDNREKRGERDVGRGRAAARRGRGGFRSREGVCVCVRARRHVCWTCT